MTKVYCGVKQFSGVSGAYNSSKLRTAVATRHSIVWLSRYSE